MRHLNDQYFSGNQLKEVADPSVATDAATKGYVDGKVVQSDWNQSDNTAPDYIKHKPTIPTLRTINGEQLTDSSLGNINIHDGFYFPNAVQDYDGNWYGAVVIGDQVWMAENLRTTHDAEGNPIAGYYDNTSSQIPLKYRGLLYNKAAVMNGESASTANPSGVQGIAPNGWHIPSNSEYTELASYLRSNRRYSNLINNTWTDAKSLCSTDVWSTSTYDNVPGKNIEDNNASGFNAYPVGMFTNAYIQEGKVVEFHVSNANPNVNDVYTAEIYYYRPNFSPFNNYVNGITYGFSVRCVSDLTPIQFRDWYIEQYGSMQHHIVDYSDIENTPDSETVYVTATKTGNVYYLQKSPQELRDLFTAKKTVFVVTAADGRVFYRERNSNPAFFSVSGNTAYQLYFNSNEENGVQTPWNLVSYTKGLPSYTNKAGWVLAVNSTESNVEWVPMQGGGGSAGQLSVTDDDNGNIALSLSGGSQSLVALDDDNGNITLTLN